MMVFVYMDQNQVFRLDHPTSLTNESFVNQKSAYKKWDQANHLSLDMIKLTILESIKDSTFENKDVVAFLKEIVDRYAHNEKVEININMSKLITMRFNEMRNIHEYILCNNCTFRMYYSYVFSFYQ